MTCIYGLLDPDTLEIRYVGKTSHPKTRLRDHCLPSQLRIKTKKNSWIKSIGCKPGFIILEHTTKEQACEREMHWIKELKALGARLTNGTEGGDGHKDGAPLSEITKQRISQALKGKRTPEWTANNLAAVNTPENKERRAKHKLANKIPNSVTGFVGVTQSRITKRNNTPRFVVEGKFLGIRYYVGYYVSAKEAAKAYDDFIVSLYEEAQTNGKLGLI